MGVGETDHFLRTGGTHACSKEGVQKEGRCKEGREEGNKEGYGKKGCKEEEVTSRTLFGARRSRRAFFVAGTFQVLTEARGAPAHRSRRRPLPAAVAVPHSRWS